MKLSCLPIAAVLAAFAIAGCGNMQTLQQSRDDTKTVGLLVKSVGTSLESYQKQRDAIAVATLRNRQALERLASLYEANTAGNIATWEIAGQPKRKELYLRVRTTADAIQAEREQRNARAREQEQELAKTRSAVSANTTKLVESSATLVKLGEPRSPKDEAAFYLSFAKDVRADIAKDSEAAATAAGAKAKSAVSAKGEP